MLDRKTAQEISELCVEKIDWTIVGIEVDFLPRLKAGDSYSASLMGHRGSVGSRFTGDRVAAGLSQPPSHIASTGV